MIEELNKIHKIDCLQGLSLLPDESIDLIITSPPYNIGINYNSYLDNIPRDDYLDWMEELSRGFERVLKKNGSVFINIGGTVSNQWIPFDVANRFRESFILQNTIHWIKSISIPQRCFDKKRDLDEYINIGHYKPINSKRYHHDNHEFIFHFTKTGNIELDKLSIGVPYTDKSNISRWKSDKTDNRDRGNVWFIPYETIQTSRAHPAVFPVQLPEYCIRDHGISKSKIVLDPFMGSGTTAIACINLGVNYIGFEIDQKYIDIAQERIEKGQSNKKYGKNANLFDFDY